MNRSIPNLLEEPRMNPYEQAAERCETAAQAVDAARAAYRAALDEQMQALTALAWYEEKPGIPLPQYRQVPGPGLASCGHPADEDGECSCSYWPERAPLEI